MFLTAPSHPRYQAERALRVAILQILNACLAAALLSVVGLAGWIALRLTAPGLALALHDHLAKVPGLVPSGTCRRLTRCVLRHPAATLFMLGFVVGLCRRPTRARRCHDRWLSPFDAALLRPIRRPRALDPLRGSPAAPPEAACLPWIEPFDGPRRLAWEALRRAVLADRDPDSGWRGLTWTPVIGRSGLGKTRMAVELARLLARRDVLGQAADSEAGRRAARKLRRAAWLRQWRANGPAHDDPWDAYRIVVGAPDWRDRLRAWRPRRATLLLLDDPLPDELLSVIEVLAVGSSGYRHPVRVIATMPDLVPSLGVSATRWGDELIWSGPATFSGTVVAVRGEQLTSRDIRLIALHGGLNLPGWQDADVGRFLRACGGNPLLAELAFGRLAEGRSLDAMNPAGLIGEQAQRILAALSSHGLGTDPQLHAIAAACLAGGARPAVRAGAILPAFKQPELKIEALRGVFGRDTPAGELPTIGPEQIGDALMRHILKRARDNPVIARQIAAAAWRTDPAATLRAARRLMPAGDALGLALTEELATESGLDPLESALLLTEVAVLVPRDLWDGGDTGAADATLARAIAAIEALPPALAAAAAGRFAAVADVSNLHQIARGGAALTCFCVAIRRGLAANNAWSHPEQAAVATAALRTAINQALRWGVDETAFPQDLLEVPAALIRRLATLDGLDLHAPGWTALTQTLDRAWRLRRLAGATTLALSEAGEKMAHGAPDRVARCIGLRLAGAALRRTPELVEAATAVIDRAAIGDRPAARAIVLERARAWRQLAWLRAEAGDVAAARDAARAVDGVVAPHAGERIFEVERARAWRLVCAGAAEAGDVAAAEAAFTQVEQITGSGFRGVREMDLEQARAWKDMALLRASVVQREDSLQAAGRIDAIVQASVQAGQGDRDLELTRAQAWVQVAYAQAEAGEVEACAAAVGVVDRLVRLGFAGEREFEFERVQAWRQLAFVQARTGDPGDCEDAALRVDRLVQAGFATDPSFQFERAAAWMHVASARARTHDVAGCRAAATRTGVIADAMPDEQTRLLQAQAWRCVAYACSMTGDAAGCALAAGQVNRIARMATNDAAMFTFERAQAWRLLADAQAVVGDRPGALQSARMIDVIVGPALAGTDRLPPDRLALAREAAAAWRGVAYLHVQSPELLSEAVRHLELIAGRDPCPELGTILREVRGLRITAMQPIQALSLAEQYRSWSPGALQGLDWTQPTEIG